MTDLISIIIPCYNYGNFLPRAVSSVIAQTYNNWECLIVDDGSTDNSAEVAQTLCKQDGRIRYLPKTNGGLSSARNYGISKCTGKFICFLDADDLFHRQKLEIQLESFHAHPEADIVYGQARFFEKDDLLNLFENKRKTQSERIIKVSGRGRIMMDALLRENIMVVSAPLLRAEVFQKAGLFDESYRSYEDWHFWIKCAMAGLRFYYCDKPEVVTYISFGHESMMSDKRKLGKAAIQLRKFLSPNLTLDQKLYNYFRLLRTKIKLALS